MVEITLRERPTQTDVNRVMRGLVRYNRATRPGDDYTPIAVFLTEPGTGKIVGGLTGDSAYDWLFIQYLHVPQELRGRGLGTELMGRVEAWARGRNLTGIWLDTFDFQARPFYEKLGYEVFGTLDDHPADGARYFMRKRLDGAAGSS